MKKNALLMLKAVCMLVFSLCFFNSCKKNDPQQQELGTHKMSSKETKITDIGYQGFLGSSEFGKLGKLKNTFQTKSNAGKVMALKSEDGTWNGINVYTDSVRKIVSMNGTSYVFRIPLVSPNTKIFQNLTISILKDTTLAFITTYTPNNQWLSDRKKNRFIAFAGEVAYRALNLNQIQQLLTKTSATKAGWTNGKAMGGHDGRTMGDVTICNSFVVFSTEAYPCSDGGHMPWDNSCAWNTGQNVPPGETAAGYRSIPHVVTYCTTMAVSTGEPTGPGGNNTGDPNNSTGETSPYLPGDYSPCDPGVACNSFGITAGERFANEIGGLDFYHILYLNSNHTVLALLMNYNNAHNSSSESKEFIRWAVRYLNDNQNITPQVFINQFDQITQLASEYGHDGEFNSALSVTLLAFQNGSFDSNYAAQNIGQPSGNPASTVLAAYFNAQVAIIKFHHPNWSTFKVYWEASREMIHLALDVGGLVPVIGEVCDLTNGAIYTIQGDGINASLSFASAIPIAGWAAAGGKFAIKVVDATAGGKTTLKWVKKANGVIDFGLRSQLRKTLKLAPGNPLQAHHIIPWEFTTNTVVKKAAEHGFHMNEALNGIGLAKSVHVEGMVHSQYNTFVRNKLDHILSTFGDANGNINPQVAEIQIINLTNQIKNWINTHPGVNLNYISF